MEQRFREQVIADLTELKTSGHNIQEHLVRLNGSVAKHEEAIGRLQLHSAMDSAKDKTNSVWIKASWGLFGGALLIVFKDVVGLFLK